MPLAAIVFSRAPSRFGIRNNANLIRRRTSQPANVCCTQQL